MNSRAITLIIAGLLFVWAAAASTGTDNSLHVDWGTPGVLTNLALALVVVYWFLTDHPPIRR